MSRELNCRVAELVMGELEPDMPSADVVGAARVEQLGAEDGYAGDWHYSQGGNWRLGFFRAWRRDFECWWEPNDFSGDLEQATRAVNHFFDDAPALLMEYYRIHASSELQWSAYSDTKYGYGETLPEAICNLLVILVNQRRDG